MGKLMHQINSTIRLENFNFIDAIVYLSIISPILVFPFSPLISFIFCILNLIFGSSVYDKLMRLILGCIAAVSLAFTYGSINFIEALRIDLSVYYSAYKVIENADLSEVLFSFEYFGGGLEFGILLLYKLYSLIFDDITPYNLAVYNAIICGVGTVIWFELYGTKYISENYRALCLAFILVFISMNTFSFLQRQALSTLFILFAIEARHKASFILLTLIAFIFHTTSLPIILIWRYLFNKQLSLRIILFSLIGFISIRLIFYTLVLYLSNLGYQKATYYLVYNSFSIISMRFLILILLLVLSNIIFYKIDVNNKWKTPVTVMGIFHLAFAGIPLFSERINFIFLFLYGFFLLVSLQRVMTRYLILPLFIYLLFFISEKANIININFDPYWSRYPIYSFEPFYFLFQ